MSGLTKWPRWWHSLWFEQIGPEPLAAFRIAFSVYLFAYFLRFLPILDTSFSNQGVYSPYLIGDAAPEPLYAHLLFGFCLLCIICLGVGFFTRLVSIGTFLFFIYYYLLNFAVNNTAYDRLNCIILFIVCCTDAGAAWSIDAKKRSGTRLIPAWQIRLLQIQLVLLYCGSGLWKLCNTYWHTGDMLHYTLAGPWASPLAFQFLHLNFPDVFFTLLTWFVIAFELLGGFGLFFKRTRPLVMAIGCSFHLLNGILLMIPQFMNCVALYALFVDWKRGCGRPPSS